MQTFAKPMKYRQFIKYALPSVFTMIFLSFYTTIDGFFLAKYVDANALSATNIVTPIACTIFGVSVMLATGAGAIIGERMGEGKKKEADRLFSTVALTLLLLSLLFTAGCLAFLRPICRLIGATDVLMPYVLPYAFVMAAGAVPMSFKLFFEYMVRTDGCPKVALQMSFTGLILNILLDYLFVGVWGLGTFGAGMGTVLSIGASAVIGLVHFLRGKNIRFGKPGWEPAALLKSCGNGISEMFTELSTGITALLFNLIVLHSYGEDGVAAVTIILCIYYFFISFYQGITVAAAPVVSYNVGAKNPRKIKEVLRYSFITIGITAAAIVTLLYTGGDSIISIFEKEGNVHALSCYGLLYFAPVFAFIGVNVFLSGYFTALEDGFSSAVISTLRSLIFVVVFIFTLPRAFGISGVFLTMPAAEFATLFVSVFLYFRKGRKIFRQK